MISPTITAVIPTYERPQLLKRAVNSVLAQTYPHFEILIADNASGPKTDSVVQEFMQQDKRIKGLKQTSNIGACANFQAALMQVSTPYVCFLCDDDCYAPTFFEQVLQPFSQYPNIVFSGGGGTRYFDQEYEILRSIEQTTCSSGYYAEPDIVLSLLQSSLIIQFPSILFNTKKIKEVGGFDTRLQYAFDLDIMLKCAARFPAYALLTNVPMHFYFRHSAALSSSFDLIIQQRECCYIQENVLAELKMQTDRTIVHDWFQAWKVRIFCELYGRYYEAREFSKASSYAEKIYAINSSKCWRRRAKQAALFARWSILEIAYKSLKNLEIALRKLRRQKKRPSSETIASYEIDPNAEQWKKFLLELEHKIALPSEVVSRCEQDIL